MMLRYFSFWRPSRSDLRRRRGRPCSRSQWLRLRDLCLTSHRSCTCSRGPCTYRTCCVSCNSAWCVERSASHCGGCEQRAATMYQLSHWFGRPRGDMWYVSTAVEEDSLHGMQVQSIVMVPSQVPPYLLCQCDCEQFPKGAPKGSSLHITQTSRVAVVPRGLPRSLLPSLRVTGMIGGSAARASSSAGGIIQRSTSWFFNW
jgi:hypothetical protein